MVLPYLLTCFGAVVAGSKAVAGANTAQKPDVSGDAVIVATAARMKEHRGALDRVWDAGVNAGGVGAARRAAE